MPEAPKPDDKSQPKTAAPPDVKPAPASTVKPAAAPAAPPVARVQQSDRCDDALACVAMLCKLPLEKVTELAYTLGYPKFGPSYVPDDMLVALAMKAGNWVAKNYNEFTNFETLPSIAILHVDYSEVVEMGRTVLWLRPPLPTDPGKPLPLVASRTKQDALQLVLGNRIELGRGFVIDPAFWIKPEQQILTGVATLHFVPGWFMELTMAPAASKPAKQ